MLKAAAAWLFAAGVLAAAAQPDCGLVRGWEPRGAARAYTAANLFEYMDGNAEGYVLYGLRALHGVTCERDGVTLAVDISDFGDEDSAYGMFSANVDPREPVSRLGMGGQIVPRRAIFVKGRFYVEIAAEPEGDHSAVLRHWSAELEKTVEGSCDPPAALAWFPPEARESLRLIPESVLGLRLLRRGYVGQYDFGKAFVVTEASPGAAAALMQKLRARFAPAEAGRTSDEALQATDKYLGRLYIFRKGRFVGGYANVGEGRDPAALAEALAARLP
ncbi:MAG TPA: DUF6599 family protein [Bryobacteraceae bacterium]|nr:DUF6599 family protein [Bryobacteraceae bacterium]